MRSITSESHSYSTIAIVLGLLSSCLAGCSTEQIVKKNEIVAAPASTSYLPENRIYPGDQLDIKFYYNPELNETVIVRPDGKISLQLVDDISAAGLTPFQLDGILTEKYGKELRRPLVTVIVRSFAGQQIYVGGEVEREGLIKLTPRMTALQAVINAGGFKETAKPEAVIVIRKGPDNQPTPYRMDLKGAANESLKADFQLQPYDIVYVPKTWIAEANKFVQQYIEQLFLFKGIYFSWSPVL